MTVLRMVRCFENGGYRFESLVDQRHGQFKMIPDDVQKQLVAPELLQEWSVYSIAERPALIKTMFGVTVSHRTLERFYKKNHVKFKQVR